MICPKCKSDTDNFGLHHWCRQCTARYNKARKVQKRALLMKQKIEWDKKNRRESNIVYRHASIKHKFGITIQDYIQLSEKQEHKCAVCLKPETIIDLRIVPTDKRKNLAVDHNHTTGKVRGLLCTRCNFALGYMLEDFDSILRLAKYIQTHNNVI